MLLTTWLHFVFFMCWKMEAVIHYVVNGDRENKSQTTSQTIQNLCQFTHQVCKKWRWTACNKVTVTLNQSWEIIIRGISITKFSHLLAWHSLQFSSVTLTYFMLLIFQGRRVQKITFDTDLLFPKYIQDMTHIRHLDYDLESSTSLIREVPRTKKQKL